MPAFHFPVQTSLTPPMPVKRWRFSHTAQTGRDTLAKIDIPRLYCMIPPIENLTKHQLQTAIIQNILSHKQYNIVSA
jgi:hypothetical protein